MEQTRKEEYIHRVMQANRSELVVITYEIINCELKQAKVDYEKSNWVNYEKVLKNAQAFLNEMMGSLDYNYDISKKLLEIYIYINKVIIEARMQKKVDKLKDIISIIEGLQGAFEEVEKQDNSGPVLGQTQKLYAGLTYGKGVLNEIALNVNGSLGEFRA